jgi:hypothetical protein
MSNGTDQIAQLPTQISPQALATLFPQAPATPPIAPPAGSPPDLRSLIEQQSQAGMGAFGEREKAAMDINRQLAGSPGQPGLIQQQQEASQHLAFHPSFHGGFLHNLGQALLTAGAATRPGQAVENVIYAEPRQEYAGRAEQIKQLQEEQQRISEGMAPAAQLAYKPFQAEAAERKAGAAETTAQARVQQVVNQHTDKLAQIAATKDIAAARNALQIELQNMRSELAKEVTGMKDVTQEQVAGIVAGAMQSKVNADLAGSPSLLAEATNFIQTGTWAMPQTPGGAAPVAAPAQPRQPSAAKLPGGAKGAAVPKGTIVYDPTGAAHTSDGTHPLPKGWSTKKPGT